MKHTLTIQDYHTQKHHHLNGLNLRLYTLIAHNKELVFLLGGTIITGSIFVALLIALVAYFLG